MAAQVVVQIPDQVAVEQAQVVPIPAQAAVQALAAPIPAQAAERVVVQIPETAVEEAQVVRRVRVVSLSR